MGWFEDMERAEQIRDAQEYECAMAYKDGYEQAIDDAVKVIENSKSIFDNSRHCSMGEKDRLQNLIKKLKAGD